MDPEGEPSEDHRSQDDQQLSGHQLVSGPDHHRQAPGAPLRDPQWGTDQEILAASAHLMGPGEILGWATPDLFDGS